jgi:hypothetical protein
MQMRLSVAEAAKELVGALHELEAAGKEEPPWNATAFQGKALHFIDEEGRTQVRVSDRNGFFPLHTVSLVGMDAESTLQQDRSFYSVEQAFCRTFTTSLVSKPQQRVVFYESSSDRGHSGRQQCCFDVLQHCSCAVGAADATPTHVISWCCRAHSLWSTVGRWPRMKSSLMTP